MSCLIQGRNSGNPKILITSSTVSEDTIENLADSAYLYNSAMTSTIPIYDTYSISNLSSTVSSYTLYFPTQTIKTVKVASSSSAGGALQLFNDVNNELTTNTLVFVVYNSVLNKSVICTGGFVYRYSENQPYWRGTFIGTNLTIFFRYSGQEGSTSYLNYDYKGKLLDINLAAVSTDALGMEFINNPSANVVTVLKTSITYNSTTANLLQFSGNTVNSIDLSNKDILLNGTSIRNSYAIGVSNYSNALPWFTQKYDNTPLLLNSNSNSKGMTSGTDRLLCVSNFSPVAFTPTQTIIDNSGIHYSYNGVDMYASLASAAMQIRTISSGSLTFFYDYNHIVNPTQVITVASSNAVLLVVYPYAISASYRVSFMAPIYLPNGVFSTKTIYTEAHGGQGNYATFTVNRTSTQLTINCSAVISMHTGYKIQYVIF